MTSQTTVLALILGGICALMLASCTTTHYYNKAGATNEDGARAVAWCQMRAPPIQQPFIDTCMRAQGWVRVNK